MFKKSFALVAALLLMTSGLNAKIATDPSDGYTCFQVADAYATHAGQKYNLDYETEHEIFLVYYDDCMDKIL